MPTNAGLRTQRQKCNRAAVRDRRYKRHLLQAVGAKPGSSQRIQPQAAEGSPGEEIGAGVPLHLSPSRLSDRQHHLVDRWDESCSNLLPALATGSPERVAVGGWLAFQRHGVAHVPDPAPLSSGSQRGSEKFLPKESRSPAASWQKPGDDDFEHESLGND